jgi:hypothetical protein
MKLNKSISVIPFHLQMHEFGTLNVQIFEQGFWSRLLTPWQL